MEEQDKFTEVKHRLDDIMRKIDERKKLKKELVDLGIAEDDETINTIRIKPEKFKEHLIYLREHPNAKI